MRNPAIVIIDYGVGNTHSVYNGIKNLGYKKIKITDNHDVINNADALILPGVGAFESCINNLRERSLHNILPELVLVKKKPILGICVGMQLLADFSEENGIHSGFGWIEGTVKKLVLPKSFPVPHVGWNNIIFDQRSSLFNKIEQNSNFYFDHSYYFSCSEKYVSASCEYGINVTAAVQKENIFGVQFHPEKSHTNGLKLFRSFFNSI